MTDFPSYHDWNLCGFRCADDLIDIFMRAPNGSALDAWEMVRLEGVEKFVAPSLPRPVSIVFDAKLETITAERRARVGEALALCVGEYLSEAEIERTLSKAVEKQLKFFSVETSYGAEFFAICRDGRGGLPMALA